MTDSLKIWILFLTLWLSGAAFTWPMEKKNHFWRNFGIWFGVTISIFSIFLYFVWDGQLWLEMLAKNVAILSMFLYLYSCWEITVSVTIYNTIWAVSLWQLLLELWKVTEIFWKETLKQNLALEIVTMIFLFAFSYVLCVKTIAKWMPNDRKKSIGPRQCLSALLLFGIIEMLSYAPALRFIDRANEDWKFLYLSQVMCIVILYLQNELFKKSDIKQELELMNLLWKKEQEQYQLAKENISLINQKTHDLKHHIRAIRHASPEELEKYLNEMEGAVHIYEAIAKTGNDVFDTILTEKSLYCKDRGIQVSCVADGSLLDFINTVDLYALLGNALDNAMEAVEKFKEIEKRQIDVMIYRQQNFLVINIINPIPERLVFEEELPRTTKEDKKLHGFGLRSMKYIVRKYDGFLNVSEEDGCFSLKILIPIPK